MVLALRALTRQQMSLLSTASSQVLADLASGQTEPQSALRLSVGGWDGWVLVMGNVCMTDNISISITHSV